MKEVKCEVLIIGAGIAGSVCARALEKLGIDDVCIIERCKEIGLSHSPKIDFAEDKGLKKLLERYDLPIAKETNISRWHAPNGEMFELKSMIEDIWFRRGDENSFERSVLQESNANIITNTEVQEISDGKVVAINHPLKEETRYNPEYIVVASGDYLPYLNKDKGMKITQPMYARGFVLDGLDVDLDIPHIIFDADLFPGSYLYMVRGSEESTGILAYGSLSKTALKLEEMKRIEIVKDATAKSKVINEIGGAIYVGRPCLLGRDNLLFVGDAANLMDPFLSYGVSNAVKSGTFAAEAIADGKSVVDHYKSSVHEEIFPELKRQFKLRKFFERLDNEDFNEMIGLLRDSNADGDIEELFARPFNLISKLAPQLVRRRRLASILLKGIRSLV